MHQYQKISPPRWLATNLMRKSEILPPTTRKSRVFSIISLLIRRHLIPLPLLLLIPENIVRLRKQKRPNSQAIDNYQILVSAMIQRLIICFVNERRDDRAELDHHVVKCSRDGTRSNIVAIPRCPGDENGVTVWIG